MLSSMPPKPTCLSSNEAIDLIGKYLAKEWKYLKPEDVDVVRMQTGFNNQVYFCSNSKTIKEPRKLVIRKYGGNIVERLDSIRYLSTTEELVLVCELERRNLAPKLYGIFDEGRIEEYIDSHPVTDEEVFAPLIVTDFAKNLARFHAVDTVPFPRPGYEFIVVLRDTYQAAQEGIGKIFANKDLTTAHHVFKYDWEKELEWLSPLIHSKRHRIVLMHWDTHRGNIGVKNTRSESDGGLFTFLFDYERTSYNMRGKDLALFLLSRLGLVSSRLTSKTDFPSEEESQLFMTEYINECKLLFDDWDETKMDSFHHIMMETIIGGMVSALCFLFSSAHTVDTFLKRGVQYVIRVITRLNQCYFTCKKRLQEKYPNYATEL